MRFLLIALIAAPVFAQTGQSPFDIVYPAGVSWNVKTDCGAVGNGTTDDSNAIQNCIYKAGSKASNISTVYFPSGTYLVSSAVSSSTTSALRYLYQAGTTCNFGGGFPCWVGEITLQGQNSNTTTIKLASGTYTNTSCTPILWSANPGSGHGFLCPAVIQTANNAYGNTGQSDGEYGENAFNDSIRDLTIDVNGNAGATGISWQCSNAGTLRNVIVKGGGAVGIGNYAWGDGSGVGPCFGENVNVAAGTSTFQYDIVTTSAQVGVTWEHVGLSGCTVVCWQNSGNNEWVRDLQITTTGSIPAINNSTDPRGGTPGTFTVISSTWTGSGSLTAALLNSGFVYARAITTTGYTSAINGVAGANISEYVSMGVTTLFTGSASTSLNLPINETPPLINDNNFANWESVETTGATCGSGDSTAAIQAALNSGHSTVYFPHACVYTFTNVSVPTGVTRVLGFQSLLHSNLGNFQLNGTSGSYVEFRGFEIDTISMTILNNQTVPLVMRDFLGHGGTQYDSINGNGNTLYMADFDPDQQINIEVGVTAWGRALDIEASGSSFLDNHGGTVWVLGFKTEQPANTSTAHIYATGGFTEVIGGGVYNPSTDVSMKSVNASVSVAGIVMDDPSLMISETRGATTNTLGQNGNRICCYIGLWIGYVGSAPPTGCSGGGPGSGATCVQFTRGFDQSGGSLTTLPATFPASVKATDLLVVSCMFFDAGLPAITLKDSLSQTYTATAAVTSGSFALRTFYLASTSAGADTVTCQFGAAVTYPAILIQEYSGLVKSSVLDGSASTNSGTGTMATGGNVTTTQTDMIYGVYYGTQSLAGVPPGWFIRNQGSPDSDGSEDIAETSAGAYSSSFTLSASGSWVAGTLAFKILGGTTILSQAIVVF